MRVERIFVVTVKPGKLEIDNCSLYDNAFVLIRFTELSHQTTNLLVVGCRPKASQAVGAAIFSSALQIYTVFNCVPLSTVISLCGLHLIALYSTM